MGQGDLYEKMAGRQDALIQELQRNIALLEQQNSLQKELITGLQEENRMLREYLGRYADMAHQGMDTACDQKG